MSAKTKKTRKNAIVEYLDYQISVIKARKNAIVEYLDYQIPGTELKGPKGNGDMQEQSEVEMRNLPVISIYGYVGCRLI